MTDDAAQLLATAEDVTQAPEARRDAIAKLGRVGDGSCGQPLSVLLKDTNQGVAIESLKALLRLLSFEVGELSPRTWLGALQGVFGSSVEEAREWAYDQVVTLFRALAAQNQTAFDEIYEVIDISAPWSSALIDALRNPSAPLSLDAIPAQPGAARKWAASMVLSQADRDPRCLTLLPSLRTTT